MRLRWRRALESVVLVAVFVAVLLVLVGPWRLLVEVRSADARVYALTFPLALVWLFAWSQTLLELIEARTAELDSVSFYLVYLVGMFARGLVPGGSISGPAVMAYVVSTYTEVEPERSFAMATISELCYWGASMTAAVSGVLVLATTNGLVPAAVWPLVAAAIAGAVVVVVLAVGVARPGLTRRALRVPLIRLGRLFGRVSDRAGAALAPGAVEERIDNAVASVRALGAHPRAALVALAYAHLGVVCTALSLYLCLLAIGHPADPWVPLFVVPVAGLVRGVSILPGGLGSVEAGMVGLLTLVMPLSAGLAGTAVLLHRLTTFGFRLLVGAVCLVYLGLAKSLLGGVSDPSAG